MKTYTFEQAATFPVSLSEAKNHLKVDISDDDNLITSLIESATQLSEEYTNRFFITTVVIQTCSTFEESKELFKSDVSGVTTIKYYDSTNTQVTWSSANYIVANQYKPCQIELADNINYPGITNRIDAIEITYNVGYGEESTVPEAIKQAILLTIGNWYANRQSIVVGRTFSELSQSAKWLLDTYKIQVV